MPDLPRPADVATRGRPWLLLVLVAGMAVNDAMYPVFWLRGQPGPSPVVLAGHAIAAALGALAVVALWRRATWLPRVAVPWGGVAAALSVHRELTAAHGGPFRYVSALVVPCLYLFLASLLIGAVRAGQPAMVHGPQERAAA